MKNYYDILEVSIDASKEQIKEAYRRLAQIHHPDKNINDTSGLELFKDINEAKQVLFDESKKVEYDLMLTDYTLAHHQDNVRRRIKYKHRQRPVNKVRLNKTTFSKYALFGIVAIIACFFIINRLQYKTDDSRKYISKNLESLPLKSQERELDILSKPIVETGLAKQTKVSHPIPVKTKPVPKLVKEVTKKAIQVDRPSSPKIFEETIADIQLNQQQMMEILNSINVEKARNYNSSNCIQVCKTYNSNVKNAFDIARFLRAKGFIIAGREMLSNSYEGIKVDPSSNCIKIIIGSL